MWHKHKIIETYQQMALEECNKSKEGERKLPESWWERSGVKQGSLL